MLINRINTKRNTERLYMKKFFLFFSLLLINNNIFTADQSNNNRIRIKELVSVNNIPELKQFLSQVSDDILVRNIRSTTLLRKARTSEMIDTLIEFGLVKLSPLENLYVDHLTRMVDNKTPNAYGRAIQKLGISGFFALKGIWDSGTDVQNQEGHENALKEYGVIDQAVLDNRSKIEKHQLWPWLFCQDHLNLENKIREEIGIPSVVITRQPESGNWIVDHSKNNVTNSSAHSE